jgi:hypothetical protein
MDLVSVKITRKNFRKLMLDFYGPDVVMTATSYGGGQVGYFIDGVEVARWLVGRALLAKPIADKYNQTKGV